MIWFGIKPEFKASMAFLFILRIESRFRRRGYATEAMIQLEQKVIDNGCNLLRLHTLKTNEPAMCTYKKCGYWEYENHEHGVVLEKDLSAGR